MSLYSASALSLLPSGHNRNCGAEKSTHAECAHLILGMLKLTLRLAGYLPRHPCRGLSPTGFRDCFSEAFGHYSAERKSVNCRCNLHSYRPLETTAKLSPNNPGILTASFINSAKRVGVWACLSHGFRRANAVDVEPIAIMAKGLSFGQMKC